MSVPLSHHGSLTEAERGVLKLIADGHTNAEIASFLSVSLNTVHTHVAHILDKLDVNSRREAGRIYRALSDLPQELESTLAFDVTACPKVDRAELTELLRRLGVPSVEDARSLYRTVITRYG